MPQLLGVGVADREPVLQFFRRVLGGHAAGFAVDHARGLGADAAAQHRRPARFQVGLEQVELVGVDRALDHAFAQPVAGGDEHHAAVAGFGIQREQHAGRADVGAHHQLDAGRQRHVGVLEAVVDAVGDRPVVVQAGEHLVDPARDVFQAAHVEEGLLLARERGVRQVLGGGRGAYRDLDIVAEALEHLAPGTAYGLAECFGQRGFDDPGADFLAGLGQCATSSVSSDSSRARIFSSSPVSARKSRNASAVVANPPGTFTPIDARFAIISPSDAFLPPTCSRSSIPSWSSQRIYSVTIRIIPCSFANSYCNRQPMRRTVLFISDGTAITAETFGHSLLTQFAGHEFRQVRLPFVDTVEKAREAVDLINRSATTTPRARWCSAP